MRPPKKQYERVPVGVPVLGVIEQVLYHENHVFPGFDGKEDTKATAIRFKFTLDGCQYFHYSRWMRLSLHVKATLYKKYASALIEDLQADADIDLDVLNGMAISTVWSQSFKVDSPIPSISEPATIARGNLYLAFVYKTLFFVCSQAII